MRYLIFLLVFSFPSKALFTINKFIALDEIDDYIVINNNVVMQNPLVVNKKLIYLDKHNNLWATSGTQKNTHKLSIKGFPIEVKDNLIKSGSYVLFINKADNKLWRTNGITTTLLSNISLNKITQYQSNRINSTVMEQNAFIVYDGDSVELYQLDSYNFTTSSGVSACSFDNSNKFIFSAVNSKHRGRFFYNKGQITPIEFDENITNGIKLDFVLQHQNNCYFKHHVGSGNITYFKVDSKGVVSTITNPKGQSFYDDFFVFADKLLFFVKNNRGIRGHNIYSLPNDVIEPHILYSIDENVTSVTSLWVTNNYLYAYYKYSCHLKRCSPAPNTPNSALFVYDENFDLVQQTTNQDVHNEFDILFTEDQDFLIAKNELDEIILLQNGIESSSLRNANIAMIKILGKSDNGYYVLAKDKAQSELSVFIISNQTLISTQLTGLWQSNEWISQSLSIHTSINNHNRPTIFVSLLLLKNGLPYWVSGTATLNNGSTSQSLQLYEHRGYSFLKSDKAKQTEKIHIGMITLKPFSCNSLGVEVSIHDSENIELDFKRLHDPSIKHICVDD